MKRGVTAQRAVWVSFIATASYTFIPVQSVLDLSTFYLEDSHKYAAAHRVA